METPTRTVGAAVLLLLSGAAGSGCSPGGPAATEPAPRPAAEPPPAVLERAARADSVRQSYSDADVAFMTGMIHHHAQALVMARMAPTHDASPELRTLAARIINSQNDEIHLMQRWLRERGEPVPQVSEAGEVTMAGGDGHARDASHGRHAGHAADAAMAPMAPMAGMLTPEQMARLEAARGAEWNRLFLTYMIQHHQGALVMVEDLFDTYGAAQGDAIFKIASDIGADQRSEIDRMQRMLQELVLGMGDEP